MTYSGPSDNGGTPADASRSGGESELMMFVIDVLRHDAESVDSLVTLVNGRSWLIWRSALGEFSREEVVRALQDLVRQGMVRAMREDRRSGTLVDASAPVDVPRDRGTLWFVLTDRGRKAWEAWNSQQGER